MMLAAALVGLLVTGAAFADPVRNSDRQGKRRRNSIIIRIERLGQLSRPAICIENERANDDREAAMPARLPLAARHGVAFKLLLLLAFRLLRLKGARRAAPFQQSLVCLTNQRSSG